jgi:hypothetical protein
MKTRFVWLAIGLAFAVTLAVIIGQRLSAEAMAVMVGVVAGVAASIPTSLIVVWFATRTMWATARPTQEVPALPPEPRVVVMPQPAPAAYQSLAGYAPAMYGPMPMAMAMPGPMPAPRQFNVIGGAELTGADAETVAEVIWQR